MSLLLDALKKASDDKSKVDLEASEKSKNTDLEDKPLELDIDDFPQVDESEFEANKEASRAEYNPNQLDEGIYKKPIETAPAKKIKLALEDTPSKIKNVEKKHTQDDFKNEYGYIKTNIKTNNLEALSALVNTSNSYDKSLKNNKLKVLSLVAFILLIIFILFAYILFNEQSSPIYIEGASDLNKNKISRPIVKKQMSKTKSPNKKQLVSIKNNNKKITIKKETPKKIVVRINNKKDPVKDMMNSAYLNYNLNKYEDSAKEYKDILKLEKTNIHARLGLAANYVKLTEFKKAQEVYVSILKLDPNDSYALAGLSLIGRDQNYNQQLQINLKELLVNQPNMAHLNFALASSYANENKWMQAQKYYFNAWSIENKNSNYAFNLAVSLDHLGKYTSAIKFYELSLDLNRDNVIDKLAVSKRLKTLQDNNNE